MTSTETRAVTSDKNDGAPQKDGRSAIKSEASPHLSRGVRREDDRIRSIFDAHYEFIWRQIRRLGIPFERVDDATQQVFIVASQKLANIGEGQERSFLYGTALRVASDIRRSAPYRKEVLSDHFEATDGAELPDEKLDRARARVVLDHILEALPDECRAVFTLYELEEMTLIEIARLLEIPQGTAASRLRRARTLFQEEVARFQAKSAGTATEGGTR